MSAVGRGLRRHFFEWSGLVSFLVLAGCEPGEPCTPSGEAIEPAYELAFQSGFGGTVEIGNHSSLDAEVSGGEEDLESSDWVADFEDDPILGNAKIFFEDGSVDQRDARIVADPEDPSNEVMEYWIGEPHVPQLPQPKARIQLGLRNNEDLKLFKYSVRMRLEEGFAELEDWDEKIHWLTLAEFWNNTVADSFTFRVTLNLNKEGDGPLLWNSHAQTQAIDGGTWTDVWTARSEDAPVPLGEWFTLEIELREGCEEDGLYRVDLELEDGSRFSVMSVQGSTHHPNDPNPDGMSNINPLKLYTSGDLVNFVRGENRALRILWDDFRFETGTP